MFPIHAEAHSLPFAEAFFDVVVSMDAYHYFGTDDLYLGNHLARLVKPEGQIGIVVPGLVQEWSSAAPPEHLRPHWNWGFSSFHSPGWWRRHWERSGLVSVESADLMPNGWKHWLTSDSLCTEWRGQEGDAELLRADAGRYLGFARLVARRKPDDQSLQQLEAKPDELAELRRDFAALSAVVRDGMVSSLQDNPAPTFGVIVDEYMATRDDLGAKALRNWTTTLGCVTFNGVRINRVTVDDLKQSLLPHWGEPGAWDTRCCPGSGRYSSTQSPRVC